MGRPSTRRLRTASSCSPCCSSSRAVRARSVKPSTALRVTARAGGSAKARRLLVSTKLNPNRLNGLGGTALPRIRAARKAAARSRCWCVQGEAGQALCANQGEEIASSALVAGSWPPRPAPGVSRAGEHHVLELRAVSKRWRKKPRPVLDDVQLGVAHGTAILLTGANGAGKTTLLRLAAGVLAPDRGSVTVQGLSPERSRREFSRRIAFLSAGGSGLYARLSVLRHLDLAARLALLGAVDRAAAIERAIDAFDLAPLACERVDRMSMGQRQRLRVAMAFLHDADLALLDEPSTSLDHHGVGLLHSALSRMLARGGAAIWCEPSGGRAGFAFDRQLMLQDGALHDT
jgi:ABC-type multidrug transport system ATPase subunit